MALQIYLGDGEMIVVNGAVLRADGRLRLKVENQVTILRAREIMKAEEANTPARRLYYACMLAYIDEPCREKYQSDLADLLEDLVGVFQTEEAVLALGNFAGLVAHQKFYSALSECKKIIAYEDNVFSRVSVAVS